MIAIIIFLSFVSHTTLSFHAKTSATFCDRRRCSNLAIMMEYLLPFKKPRNQNIPGNLFVDESCIDCDVCRWMCPSVYVRKGLKSAVIKQPTSEMETIQAYSAMIACPVGSIRTRQADPLVKRALNIFPSEIDAVNIPGVYHMGYHSVESYGATSYLVKAKNNNNIVNVMIDCPRFNSRLANTVEQEGGIDFIMLTHKDDIAHHQKWKTRFPNLKRIMHRADLTADTIGVCEVVLQGGGVWSPVESLKIIHTPGHTAGSLCVLYQTIGEYGGDCVLFTGDHIAYSGSRKALDGFKRYNHGNMDVQAESINMLGEDEYPFTWILPAHGRMARFSNVEEKNKAFQKAAADFSAEDEMDGMFSVGYW